MARIGGVLFQLATQSGDVGVHGTPANGGAGSPDLAQQLHPGGDGAPSPHESEKQPELGIRHPHRLTSAQNCLGRGFEQHIAEPDRPGQTGRGPGWEPTSLAQQLFHSRDQITND
jgi:hypothetical protein